jgi:hypothetical protein
VGGKLGGCAIEGDYRLEGVLICSMVTKVSLVPREGDLRAATAFWMWKILIPTKRRDLRTMIAEVGVD